MNDETHKEDIKEISTRCGPFAVGWNIEKVVSGIQEVERFVGQARVIPLERRRAIGRKAKALFDELQALKGGGLSNITLTELSVLAAMVKPRSGRGGDRRSGEHSLEASVHRMTIRLYVAANETGGFSIGGPLTRFVAGVCALLEVKVPTEEATRAMHETIKRSVPKLDWASRILTLYGPHA